METVIVTIENGDVKIQTKGFKGKSCKAATAELEKGLGRVTSDVPTAEMHATDAKVRL